MNKNNIRINNYRNVEKSSSDISNNSIAKNSKINSNNVKRLKELWTIKTKAPVSSDPIILGNYIYFTDWDGNAYCAEKINGRIVWKINIYYPATMQNCILDNKKSFIDTEDSVFDTFLEVCLPYTCSGFVCTGTIANGIWYIASIGGKVGAPLKNGYPGMLYAIDICKRKVIWSVKITDSQWGGALGDLLFYDGLIYVGVCGLDEVAGKVCDELNRPFTPETVGAVLAFDGVSGKKVWETKTIGMIPKDNIRAKGAGVWCSFALCPKVGMIYFGTGKNYGRELSKSSDAIVALNYKTGEFIWENQIIIDNTCTDENTEKPNYDFCTGPQIFDIKDSENNTVLVVGVGSKNGYYYIFNRINGKGLGRTKVYSGNDPNGGISGNASISNGKIYIASNGAKIIKTQNNIRKVNTNVKCINANNGETIWSKRQNGSIQTSSGLLCNDVYFLGDINGNLNAYNAQNGDIIWSSNIKNASVSSGIVGDEYAIYIGLGIPKVFDGLPRKGLCAFGII